MAATIKIKNSSTASAVPTSSDLVQGELAVNVTDKRIFTENASGTVVELGTNPSILTLPDGSASAPTLTNDGDTNTGIFFPAADTVGITTGGTERARVDSSGNFGIGTSSPSLKLDVNGSAKFGGSYVSFGNNGYIRTDATNVLRFQPGSGGYEFAAQGNSSVLMSLNTDGNLGLGVTPSAWWSSTKAMQIGAGGVISGRTDTAARNYFASNAYLSATPAWTYITTNYATRYEQNDGQHQWYTAASGTAGNAISFTQAMTLTAGSDLLVGTTTAGAGIGWTTRFALDAGGNYGAVFKTSSTSLECIDCWNTATTGNNAFVNFYTEASPTGRGSITYNRGGGLVAYNTTSDYRAKTVTGPVQNALSKLTSLKPSTGRMNGAEFDIDFFVAHELQEVVPSAVTGEKDAVKEDGTPIYQMVDKSALIPLLTAAIQELKAEFDAYKASHP